MDVTAPASFQEETCHYHVGVSILVEVSYKLIHDVIPLNITFTLKGGTQTNYDALQVYFGWSGRMEIKRKT